MGGAPEAGIRARRYDAAGDAIGAELLTGRFWFKAPRCTDPVFGELESLLRSWFGEVF